MKKILTKIKMEDDDEKKEKEGKEWRKKEKIREKILIE